MDAELNALALLMACFVGGLLVTWWLRHRPPLGVRALLVLMLGLGFYTVCGGVID